MSFAFFKQRARSLKSLMTDKFGDHIIDVDVVSMTQDEVDRIPQMIKAMKYPPIVAVILIQTKSNYEAIYDDGIARKYHEYRYYLFSDGNGNGFLPTDYDTTIQQWRASSP